MAFAFIADNTVEQYPIGSVEIKRRFPNTSFSMPLEGQDLSEFGVAVVVPTDPPTVDRNTQKLEEATPELDGSTWRQAWNVIELSADELQQVEDNAAASVRATRDQKLTDTDWTQMPDSPLSDSDKTAWATYRQSLRDLPSTDGFPHAITWPEEPNVSTGG